MIDPNLSAGLNPSATAPQDAEEARATWRALLLSEGFKAAVLDDEVIDLAILMRAALSADSQVVSVFAQMTGPELTAARAELKTMRGPGGVFVSYNGAISKLLRKAPRVDCTIVALNAEAEAKAAEAEQAEEHATLADDAPPSPAEQRMLDMIAATVILRSTLERILVGELAVSEHTRAACFSALTEAARITGDTPPNNPTAGAVMRADVRTRANVSLGMRDRIKVLLGGRVHVEISAQTERDAGRIGPVQRAVAVKLPFWPRPPMWSVSMDPK